MAPPTGMPAIDIVRPERMAVPAAMVVAAVVAPAVVIAIVLLSEGRSGQQHRKSGSRQHRTESTKSHS
jgi:hypothetical protein